jgi:tripartite-type tricarboxylate transporter receptor subunit TctC
MTWNRKLSVRRRTALGMVTASVWAAAMPFAQADAGVVKLILPNATGSGIDAIARAAQPAMAKSLHAAVVVENQAGAGGVVGLQNLARSAPDGKTLSVVSNNVVIFPSILKSLPFDMPGDFTPIAIVGAAPMVLAVNPTRLPVKDVTEMIALLKSKPDEFNFGSGGNGTILHLASELLLEATQTRARHVPYKGVGAMVADLMGGQIDFATTALSSVQGQIQAGSLRAIGLMTSQRSASAPHIPTLAEQGLASFAVDAWFGVIGPKGMNAETVRKTHAAVVAAFDDPAVKDIMAKQGNTIHVTTPEQAQQVFRAELVKYAALVKRVGLQPQ